MHYQDPLVDNDQTENRIGDSILRIIEQYKNQPSIIAINNQNMDRQCSSQEITKSETNQKILNLDSSNDLSRIRSSNENYQSEL